MVNLSESFTLNINYIVLLELNLGEHYTYSY